jgi:DNA-binding NarL/FixJ family response regulator
MSLLEQEDNIEVIGEAENGRDVVESYKRLKPDVVVIDITMPEMNGILATAEILKLDHEAKVLILSMHLNEVYIAETLGNGAYGYMLKDCASEELVGAIELLSKGETYLCPKAASMVVKNFVRREGHLEKLVFDVLSHRELQVLQLVSEGKSSKKIAEALYISQRTVDNHRSSIMRKLDLHDIQSLVKFAIRTGISKA